jgi:hypothetical protein
MRWSRISGISITAFSLSPSLSKSRPLTTGEPLMASESGDDPPPKPADLAGWQQAVTDGRLDQFRLEDIVAAIQDLHPNTGRSVLNALARHLSDAVIRTLRGWVGTNYPNQGWDIIYRVHSELFVAILQPESKDGKGLRLAFGPRLKFRMKDAIRAESRAFRHTATPEKSTLVSSGEDAEDTLQNLAATPSEEQIEQEQIEVDMFLEANVNDERKRLAFHLYMNGTPAKSKKTDSIAAALGITDQTARAWIKEVQAILKSKVGDGV